ncbi:MAG: DivIVA domain-containing protein [Candidatus Caldatribacterium sp.]|uniref:DivIVA domain-containing protein n=1 Tax=Candidatus Caldatribacterium sp. TaxID=2282143 RepID=UPI0029920112|nr:DivIVA domain-containing protein [Candidatus Caldatribacterium sp.]MCX7729825.1 DivIVA domain-containing protein [Candidatus Caldatribacterium sp.]MDW8080460.1 DivIVA domain-containing protein [Candidatus Calescibacterium sp.]
MRGLPLKPEDIAEAEFSRSFRGYNEEEVREFLEEVAAQLASVLEENRELRRKLLEMQTQFEEWKKQVEVEKELARRESQMIIKEAQLKAQKIVDEALEKRREIEASYRGIFEKYRLFQIRFKSLLQTFMESLEKEDLHEAAPEEGGTEVVRFSFQDLRNEGKIGK